MVEQLASKIVLQIKNRQVDSNNNIHIVKSKEIQNILTNKYLNNFTTTTTAINTYTNKVTGIDNVIENHLIDKKEEEEDEDNIHIIFSTDCSFFQDWQTLLLFHSAIQVKQHGKITRIASGCNEEKKKELITLYKKLFPLYSIHYTPDFKKDSKTGKKYDFYNKPYGIQHWLQYGSSSSTSTSSSSIVNSGTIIIILDPDMIFLRPITSKIYHNPANIYSKKFNPTIDKIPFKVKASSPVAQLYGLGAPWTFDRHRHFNRSFICGEGSPCLTTTRTFGEEHYR